MYLFLHCAITAYPFLNFLASDANQREASLSDFSYLFFIFWAIALLACEVVRKIFGMSRERILTAYTFFVLLFFSYQRFIGFIEKTHLPKGFYIFSLCLLGGSFFVYKFSKNIAFRKAVQAMILFLFLFGIGENIFLFTNRKDSTVSLSKKDQESYSFQEKPNVYFLLLDTYPREDTLKKYAKFDNSDFVSFFKEKGFFVAEKSFSNYRTTWPSLSATFQMDYLKKGDINFSDVMSPDKSVLKIFRDNGYNFVLVPSPYEPLRAWTAGDYHIFPVSSVLSSITNINFLNSSLLVLVTPFLKKFSYFSIKEIKSIFELPRDKPKFVFIHFIHLHDFVYDANCKVQSSLFFGKGESSDMVTNLKCLNSVVKESIDEIIAHDPKSIVIVQGDHGPWYWQENSSTFEEFEKGFSIFSAIYMPGLNKESPIAHYLEGAPSPVNNFRIVFSYLSKAPLELLPEYVYGDDESKWDLTHFRAQ